MPTVEKSVLLPYSASQMFALISGVEEYPQFLPWCGSTHVLERRPEGMVARLEIAYRGLRQSFTTENLHLPDRRIELRLRDGPFSHLQGHWEFLPLQESACKVVFRLEYGFASSVLARAVGPVFGLITGNLVEAFVRRAEQLHG